MSDEHKQNNDLFKLIKDSYHGKNIYHEENQTQSNTEELLKINTSSEKTEDKPIFTQKVYLTDDGLNALVKSVSQAMKDNHVRSSEVLSRKELKDLLNVVEKPNEADKPIHKKKVLMSEKGLEAIIKAMAHESERAHVKVNNILSEQEINQLINSITDCDPDEDEFGYGMTK